MLADWIMMLIIKFYWRQIQRFVNNGRAEFVQRRHFLFIEYKYSVNTGFTLLILYKTYNNTFQTYYLRIGVIYHQCNIDTFPWRCYDNGI